MSTLPSPDFNALTQSFRFENTFLDAGPYGNGHIHATYAARFIKPDGSIQRYIFQRINHHVFRDPPAVIENMRKVTHHLSQKILDSGGDPQRETLTLVETVDGGFYYQDEAGETWRAMLFIEGAQTYQSVRHPAHYTNAARAFGRFQKLLADFPVQELTLTIPDFHYTPKRLAAFQTAIERDACGRVAEVGPEIEFILSRTADTHILVDMQNAGRLPERVTHNDTKMDNVMIDDLSGEGICVIDLDTVMPGLAPLDFGDTVRSAASTAVEDEPDLTQVHFDLSIFERLAKGYLAEARGFLCKDEIDHLAFASRLITFEQGIRFLADYLNGDIYYRIHRPLHNLERARTQLRLAQEMETCYGQMQAIINKYR